MIGRLVGTLEERDGTTGILDVGGVGYEVFAPVRVLEAWLREDGPSTAFISTQVRDDAIALYGFGTREEKACFTQLIGVSKIGPKLALAALDAMQVDDLRMAIESDDVRTLSGISGIGKKTAQRMVLELKGKLAAGTGTASATGVAAVSAPAGDPLVAALENLGYRKAEIDGARARLIAEGLGDDAPIATRLRAALKVLYGDNR